MFQIRSIIDCPTSAPDMRTTSALPFAQEKPVFFHTLGCAASGKTTLLRYLREQGITPDGALPLAFDSIMEAMPSYQYDKAEFGAERAFNTWEVPARAAGYDLLEAALNNRSHIVFEHSGAREDHVALLLHAKRNLGYKIVILETSCDPELALLRAAPRQRHMPLGYVYDRKKIIDRLRPAYQALADEYFVYNTEQFPPQRRDAAQAA